MKKLFILFVMSIICLDVWPQGKLKTQCKFGLKLGLGLQATTGCPIKTKPGVAFIGGMWVQLKISKSWTMQSEVDRIDKGTGGRKQRNQFGHGDYELQLTYFEVPILFQYHKKNVYFEFGPSLATLINSGEYSPEPLPYPAELYPFSNRDFSFNLGTGFVCNEKWLIGLRLSHSLLPVRKQLAEPSYPVYNRGIVLSVSRQINLKASGTKQSQVIE